MKLGKEFFVGERIEVKLPYNGKEITLYANEIGYLEMAQIGARIEAGDDKGLIMIVAASITDADGNKFTIDEVNRLKKEAAEPLFKAALKVNELDGEQEKN